MKYEGVVFQFPCYPRKGPLRSVYVVTKQVNIRKRKQTNHLLTFDFTKLYLATILIKSSTVQNGVSIKSTQITHFALTFSYSFIYISKLLENNK